MFSIKIGERVYPEKELESMGIDLLNIKKSIERKNEINEIVNILGYTPIDFVDSKLVSRLYDRVKEKYRGHRSALAGIYLMGYIYGIRTERKRRADRAKDKSELNQ